MRVCPLEAVSKLPAYRDDSTKWTKSVSPPEGKDTMAEAIPRLCRSPARRHELRQLARRRAEELSWDACGDAI
jgi:hypothetical protein